METAISRLDRKKETPASIRGRGSSVRNRSLEKSQDENARAPVPGNPVPTPVSQTRRTYPRKTINLYIEIESEFWQGEPATEDASPHRHTATHREENSRLGLNRHASPLRIPLSTRRS